MGKILHWLQARIKHWTKPATSVLIISILLDLTRSRTDLVVENALLRQQLIVLNRQVKRPQLTNPDRFRLVFLSHFTKLLYFVACDRYVFLKPIIQMIPSAYL